jgi:hypothetical protein
MTVGPGDPATDRGDVTARGIVVRTEMATPTGARAASYAENHIASVLARSRAISPATVTRWSGLSRSSAT